VANVAHLPGIVNFSLAMPDVHWGYGFPIGGVAAFDLETGVVSPGGVGYDINCGCRLMATNLTLPDIREKLKDLTEALYRRIPSGVGSTGYVKLSFKDQKKVLAEGAAWAVNAGFGSAQDLETTEDGSSNWAPSAPAITFWKSKSLRKSLMKPRRGFLVCTKAGSLS
jgi:tRNA-splicing ligase RtcB